MKSRVMQSDPDDQGSAADAGGPVSLGSASSPRTPVTRRVAGLATLGVFVVAAVVVVLLLTGCTDAQKRTLGEEDVRVSLRDQVAQTVEDQGLSISGSLQCTSDITTGSDLTATCEGTTKTGATVHGGYDGTADVDAETCRATLVVEIDGTQAARQAGVRCFE
jgi:hypothetical protein